MKKFLLKLLMGASLTSSVFIFQACYGTPPTVYDIPRNLVEVNQVEVGIPQDPGPETETAGEEEDTPALD
ncbi:MAG: hypothetical protein IJK05_00270 [Bacteroidales bacterium]|nr:hypothetical protein [Bacteroidales bacterium]